MRTKVNAQSLQLIFFFSSYLICMCIITRELPGIFLNYIQKPYNFFPYYLTVLTFTISLVVFGSFVDNLKMQNLLQQKWMRGIHILLLSPLWVIFLLETMTSFSPSSFDAIYLSTEIMHLWFGGAISISITLLTLTWSSYFVNSKKKMVEIMPTSILLSAFVLLVLLFSDTTLFSVVLIFIITLLASNTPDQQSTVLTSDSNNTVKSSFLYLSIYPRGAFLIGLAYQLLESISSISKEDVKLSSIHLIACIFIISITAVMFHATYKTQKDAKPNIRFVLITLSAFVLFAAPSLSFAHTNSFSLSFVYGITRSIHILAALCIGVGSFIMLFRMTNYLGKNALKNSILGYGAFYFGTTFGILIVGYQIAHLFSFREIELETIAITILICATFLILVSSLADKGKLLRVLFGDGKLPNDTLFLEKTPLKVRYIAQKFKLTGRESEIMELIIRSYTSKQIAEKLFLSKKTIPGYRDSLYKKLGVHSKREMSDLVETIPNEKLADLRKEIEESTDSEGSYSPLMAED